MTRSLLKSILNNIKNKGWGVKKYTEADLLKVIEIVEALYTSENRVKLEKKIYFKDGFSVGYRRGYMHRSNQEYSEAIFNFWKQNVATDTYANSSWGKDDVKDLEIVEPEIIIR